MFDLTSHCSQAVFSVIALSSDSPLSSVISFLCRSKPNNVTFSDNDSNTSYAPASYILLYPTFSCSRPRLSHSSTNNKSARPSAATSSKSLPRKFNNSNSLPFSICAASNDKASLTVAPPPMSLHARFKDFNLAKFPWSNFQFSTMHLKPSLLSALHDKSKCSIWSERRCSPASFTPSDEIELKPSSKTFKFLLAPWLKENDEETPGDNNAAHPSSPIPLCAKSSRFKVAASLCKNNDANADAPLAPILFDIKYNLVKLKWKEASASSVTPASPILFEAKSSQRKRMGYFAFGFLYP